MHPNLPCRGDRLVGEWLAAGRRIAPAGPIWPAELVERFVEYASGYFVKPDGSPTPHLGHLKNALKILVRFYADTLAENFGPLALENVREEMIRQGWSRVYINQQVQKVRRVFRCGQAACFPKCSGGPYRR